MSSRSPSSSRRSLAAPRASSREPRLAEPSSVRCSTSSRRPMKAFSGVRISWPRWPRNWPFRRLARSACCRLVPRVATVCCSAWTCCRCWRSCRYRQARPSPAAIDSNSRAATPIGSRAGVMARVPGTSGKGLAGGSYQCVTLGHVHQFTHRGGRQFLHDAFLVGADGLVAEKHAGGNFLVGLAHGEQLQDHQFPVIE